MNEAARQALRELIARYGRGLLDDPRRLEALLRDACPRLRREVNVLAGAARERVPADLLGSTGGMPVATLAARLSLRLEENLGLAPDAARWAVESWGVALGVLSAPAPATAPPEPIIPPVPVHPASGPSVPSEEPPRAAAVRPAPSMPVAPGWASTVPPSMPVRPAPATGGRGCGAWLMAGLGALLALVAVGVAIANLGRDEAPPTSVSPGGSPAAGAATAVVRQVPASPSPQPVSSPTFVVNFLPVGCHENPDADARIVFERQTGTVQAMDSLIRQGDGIWYREVDQGCWTRTEPGPALVFGTLVDAERYAASLRPAPPPAPAPRAPAATTLRPPPAPPATAATQGSATAAEAVARFARSRFPGREYLGDCDLADIRRDIGKICSLLKEQRGGATAYLVGPYATDDLLWAVVQRGAGGWSVVRSGSADGAIPWP